MLSETLVALSLVSVGSAVFLVGVAVFLSMPLSFRLSKPITFSVSEILVVLLLFSVGVEVFMAEVVFLSMSLSFKSLV